MKNGLFSLGLVIKSNHNFEKTQWLVATSLTLGNFIKIDSTLVTHQRSTLFHSTWALRPTHTWLFMPSRCVSVAMMGGQPLWAIDISLAFKSGNLIKVLVPGSEVPLASPSKVGLPSPRFNIWWFGIREHDRNFGENGSQHMTYLPRWSNFETLCQSQTFSRQKEREKNQGSRYEETKSMYPPSLVTLL